LTLRSAIYRGWVTHSRRVPRAHRFQYRVWWLLVDLDELSELHRSLKVFSYCRFNLFAFHDSDYGHGTEGLRSYVEARLTEAGLAHAGCRIGLLTMPRMLGYAFNPLSIYFCSDSAGSIAAIIYEVHNTFAERHSYVIGTAGNNGHRIHQSTDKAFYVSPFLDMALHYDIRVRPPAETISVSITGADAGNTLMHAVLHGTRMPLTDGNLLRLAVTHPLVTLKVIGAIHWEGLRLWAKRVGVRPRTPHYNHAATKGGPTRKRESPHG
jgi:hypothetical protein